MAKLYAKLSCISDHVMMRSINVMIGLLQVVSLKIVFEIIDDILSVWFIQTLRTIYKINYTIIVNHLPDILCDF